MTENTQQNTVQASDIADDNNDLDLKKLLYTFLQHWLWFLGTVFLCLLIVFLYVRYTTPVYNIHSKILIKDDKSGPSGASTDLLNQLDVFNTMNNVNNEKEVLQTHYLVKKVVEELQLNVSCFAVGNIKSTELYKKSPFKIELAYLKDSTPTQQFSLQFSDNGSDFVIEHAGNREKHKFNDTVKTSNAGFIIRNNGIDPLVSNYQVMISTADDVTNKYLQKLAFNINDNQASVIEITLQEAVPNKGEDILNKLYEVYTRMNEEDKNKIADSTISFIDKRLAIVSDELSGVEKNIEQFKIRNKLSTNIPEQATLALNNASDVQKQLTEQDVEISVVEAIEDHLKKGSSQRVVPNAAVIQDPTYISTVQQYNTLVLARDRQLQTTKSDNPVIQNLDSQIEGVKQNLLISLANIKREMQIARNDLAEKNNQFTSLMKTIPSKERAFLDISRQQDIKQQLYLYLLQKREETAISKSGTLANSRLIEPGKSDALPFTPKKPLLYLVAFCAGILLPTGVLYVKNLLNNTVNNGSDVTKETNVPILGEIGHNKTGKTIVAEPNSRTALAEQFRAVRTNLQFLLKGKDHQIVMITSSTVGEGKSFFTVNLGSSLAISNKKVVLMELDLRKPKISKELGLSTEKGFTDYLISRCRKEEIIKPTQVDPNLFLISSGTIPPNPAELLLNTEVDELFAWIKTKFDYVIVDTPPAGVVIDPVLIGKHADAAIYIVRQRYTLKAQLKIVDNFKQNNKIPNLSIVLNDVRLNRTYGYGYGYHYGYGYGYSSDYYTNEKNKNGIFLKRSKKY